MRGKKSYIKKKDIVKVTKVMVFVIVTSLPFITITSAIGMDAYLDSFDNPESYLFIENKQGISATKITEPSYIIIQSIDHPDFEIKEKDNIMYSTINGKLTINKIEEIEEIGSFQKFIVEKNHGETEIVFNNQVVGKVIKVVDENPWNTISLKVWGLSINNLNVFNLIE